MSFAAERERRQTAGNRLKRLLDQQDDQEDEFYGTAYGGFVDEEEDNDYDSEDSEEDLVDSDFDQDDNEQQDDNEGDENGTTKKRRTTDLNDDDETNPRRRKKVVYQAQSLQQELRAQKKEGQESAPGDSKSSRLHHPRDANSSPNIEAKTLRTSTSVKRVELEKRQKERQARRDHVTRAASIRSTREIRRLTQEELLEEAKVTEEINQASLEAYQQIELKKKEIKRMKLIQECPRICVSSMTITNEPKTNDHDQWNDVLDGGIQLPSTAERCSRTFVSFTHLQTYQEVFSPMNSSNRRHHRRLCPVTGMPAQYFDPLTQLPYANLDAFKILRRIYAEELKKQKRTPSVLIDSQRDVNLNVLR